MTMVWCPGIREACSHWPGDVLPLSIEVSRSLYQLHHVAYVGALNAAYSANSDAMDDTSHSALLEIEAHGEEENP